MKVVFAAVLAALLLSGCSLYSDVSVSTGSKSAHITTHNGYCVTGYDIVENGDGTLTVSVSVQRAGGET